MEQEYLAAFEAALIGKTCVLTRRDYDWALTIDPAIRISINAPWRIVTSAGVALAAQDDGQVFGHLTPLDAETEAERLLSGRQILNAEIDRKTADLTLIFASDIRLDIVNMSSAHEGWGADITTGQQRLSIVAMGGGELAICAHDHIV